MADKASRRGAANLGMPLMLLTFIVIGGFFYWLFLQAQDQKAQEAVKMQEAAAARAAAYPDARDITGDQLEKDASPLKGALVRLAALPVASMLGTQGFWVELPNKNPFLVSLDDTLKADSLNIQTGQKVEVVGLIQAMNDSTANAWESSGAITQGDKLAAQFATFYLQARHVEIKKDEGVGGAAGGGNGAGSGNGAGGGGGAGGSGGGGGS